MGVFDFIKNLILGKKEEKGFVDIFPEGELRNQDIMNILVRRFEWEIGHRSVEGQMIYPMTFTIVMHNNDFHGRMVELQMIIPKVVKKFYELILKHKDEYGDITNPANYWTFRFIPSLAESMELDGQNIQVEENKMVIITTILDETETDETDKNVNVSMPVDKTGVVKKVNINLAAFGKFVSKDEPITVDWTDPVQAVNGGGVSPLASNIFDIAEKKPEPAAGGPVPHSDLSDLGAIFKGFHKGNDTYILAYKLNGEIFTYEIKSNECQVSGNGADSTKPDTFVVKSSNVKSPHIRIRKNVAENKFYVAAFAPTSIEEVQIPVSTPDEPKWVALNDGVNIDMNTFVVRFMKKH